MDTRQELIEVLRETRRILLLPGNDFAWSSWEDAESAARELDEWIAKLNSAEKPSPNGLTVLFAPTGPIQEVSLSSGWGNEFLELAQRFDEAVERLEPLDRDSTSK